MAGEHRTLMLSKRGDHHFKMELQQIMKGNFSSFMQKEIFEQPESVVSTM
jgi:glucosamine 6-phosphate synthetase-like amidotransferase/phosphosugar isomerase protein